MQVSHCFLHEVQFQETALYFTREKKTELYSARTSTNLNEIQIVIILGRAIWFTSVSWNSWRNNNRSGRYFRFDWRVELHLNGLCAIVERSPLEKSSFLRSPLDPDCQSNFAFPAFSLRFSVDRFPPVFRSSIALRVLFGPLKKPPPDFSRFIPMNCWFTESAS